MSAHRSYNRIVAGTGGGALDRLALVVIDGGRT
jgi:hypothetical protein